MLAEQQRRFEEELDRPCGIVNEDPNGYSNDSGIACYAFEVCKPALAECRYNPVAFKTLGIPETPKPILPALLEPGFTIIFATALEGSYVVMSAILEDKRPFPLFKVSLADLLNAIDKIAPQDRDVFYFGIDPANTNLRIQLIAKHTATEGVENGNSFKLWTCGKVLGI